VIKTLENNNNKYMKDLNTITATDTSDTTVCLTVYVFVSIYVNENKLRGF